MKTLLLAPELFTTDSGIPRILRLYLRGLREIVGPSGIVRFSTLNDDPVLIRSAINQAVGALDTGWSASKRSKLRFVISSLRLSAGVDLIVCGHVAQLPVAWLASRLRPGLRYALVAHGIEVWRPFTFLERLALRGAWRVLCVSAYTRSELLSYAGISPERVVVLHNGRDPELDAPANIPPPASPPSLLTVARLTSFDRYKGIDDLIRAMPRVREAVPGVTLRIIGRGDDVPRLRGLIDALGLQSAVELVGYVEDSQLRDEFARCSVFVLPSKKEGFGLVFIEAMARGRPCIGAKAGGIPEVITPETGLLVEYGDVQGIAEACVAALRTEWSRDAIFARARHFSYESFRDRLRSALEA